jgi:hypothetical protein
MKEEPLVPLDEFCRHYHIDTAFIDSLKEYELIELTAVSNTMFIHADHLQQLEKLMRLHYDLDVNMEGLDVISHLLQRMESMQNEMMELRNKLDLIRTP